MRPSPLTSRLKPVASLCILGFILLGHSIVTGQTVPVGAPLPGPVQREKIRASYGKLPLSFEANQGQTDPRVRFLTHSGAFSLFLTSDEAVMALREGKPKKGLATANVLRLKLRGANATASITGQEQLPGTSNYFIGSDPAKWSTNVPTFAKVKYAGIYSGIDLVYYGTDRQLEYDFVVQPGADPKRVSFDVDGATAVRDNANGDLLFSMTSGDIRWHKPVVYQEKNGKRVSIAARYQIAGNRVGFELGEYDAARTLYIDPLIYSTYLGGTGDDSANAIAVDSAGNAYVTGATTSTDFPTANAFQGTSNNGGAFVSKINPAGSALVYSTYLTGTGGADAFAIAVDKSGNAYVAGEAGPDFPTKSPIQANFAGGDSDGFITKINATGSALVYSTYLGGTLSDVVAGIALDSVNNAYVTGITDSSDFPTKNSLQASNHGFDNAFVTKINATGSALVYSTYLGGSVEDFGISIAVDSGKNAYVTGNTSSTDFPNVHPIQSANAGNSDAFISKINSAGSALIYSTYYGGPENDYGNSIAVDANRNAYVAGVLYTNRCNSITCVYNSFVVKINPAGSAFIYKQVNADTAGSYTAAQGVAADNSGNAYVVGIQGSDNRAYSVIYRTYVQKLGPTGAQVGTNTYLRGTYGSVGHGIAIDAVGNAFVAGETKSTNFPTKNPFQAAKAGGQTDAFVAKIDTRIITTTTLTSSPNPSTGGQAVTFTAVVKAGTATPPDGEPVSFIKGKTVLGSGSLSGGTAIFTTSTLPTGSNLIQAVYAGDSNYVGSKSTTVTQSVN